MGRAIISAFFQLVFSTLLLWTLLFFFLRLLPGGPFDALENNLNPLVKNKLEERYHLNEPLISQYKLELLKSVRGDLGLSMVNPDQLNSEIIKNKISVSFRLGGVALFISLCLFIFFWSLCVIGFLKEESVLGMTYLMTSLPTLLLAPFLLWLVSSFFPQVQLSQQSVATFLAGFVLSLRMSGAWLRLYFQKQKSLSHSLSAQFLRSLGFSEISLKSKWMFKECLLPTLSLALPSVASLFAGSLLVETIFNIPGIGFGLVQSMLERDYTLISSYVLIFGILFILSQFLFEILAKILDPRISNEN